MDPFDLAALEERGEGEADLAFRLGLDGARVDLAVGHVVAAVRGLPRPPLDGHAQVGAGAFDLQLSCAPEALRVRGQLGAPRAPVGDGVAAVLDVAGAEDEALVLRE